jgi:hypothetical protein
MMRQQPQRGERTTMKLGPNEPCACGSGKKYKKCCWLKDRELEAGAAQENRDAAAAAAATATDEPAGGKPAPQPRSKGAGAGRSSAPRRRAI